MFIIPTVCVDGRKANTTGTTAAQSGASSDKASTMASLKVAVRVRPFNQREHELGAKLIVQMDGKKTRLLKPKLGTGNGVRGDRKSVV